MGEGIQANVFVGVVIEQKLQEALDACDPYNERFFRRKDPQYLMVSKSGEKNIIGKRLGRTVDVADLDNIVLNIISILKKICPDFSFSKEQFSVFTEISIG